MGSRYGFAQLKNILKVTDAEIDEGLEIHKKSIVIDSLCLDPQIYTDRVVKRANELLDANRPLYEISEELEKLRLEELMSNPEARRLYAEAWDRSGVTAGSITLPSTDQATAFKAIARFNLKLDRLRDVIVKATRSEDIVSAKKEGKHAIIWNFQNTLAIGGGVDVDRELENLDTFYNLGVRVIQLTYNLRNFVGDGCTERYQSGLTYFGYKVVERMNKLGMLIDLSHCGYQTTMDAIEASKDPVAFTHTCCRALYDHPRAKTDEQIEALAEKGGVIGILAVRYFIGKPGNLVDMLNHVDHAVKLVGVDHVGIGTDHWHVHNYPERLAEVAYQEFQTRYSEGRRFWSGFRPEHGNDPRLYPPREPDMEAWANWPAVTIGLVSRGYSEQEIRKMIGLNWLRLLERVIG